jgi:L-ribulose-5-phosphate 4-epimerase
MNYAAIRQAAYAANMQLPELGLVLFTFGNASVVDRSAGVFAIKPSGVPYDDLTPKKMVIVDYEGRVVEGDLRPSSDTQTHAVLYKEWNTIGGIVHTHSTYSTAWAQALVPIPIMGTTHADYLTVDVPCTPPMDDNKIRGNYEHETGRQIVEHLEELGYGPAEVEMILVGSHGPFTWGESVEKAVYHAAILEEVARMAYLSRQINPAAPRLKDTLVQKHWQRKHGKGAYYGQQ